MLKAHHCVQLMALILALLKFPLFSITFVVFSMLYTLIQLCYLVILRFFFLIRSGNHDHSYILTTDADVKFHPEDVTALMDFMSRDPSVGAVCGRTHPLGSGALVWYQIFDYAIGHWLLKVRKSIAMIFLLFLAT